MDVTLLNPVFWEGKLFCWITNVLHQYDVGGITPGSFCPNARDAFDEGILIPPMKIVERGELRRDIEGVYLRASRKPYLVALDLRAQIAGNITATKRILGSIAALRRRRGQGRDAQDHRQRRGGVPGQAGQAAGRHVARAQLRGSGRRSATASTYQVMLTMRKEGDKLDLRQRGHGAPDRAPSTRPTRAGAARS